MPGPDFNKHQESIVLVISIFKDPPLLLLITILQIDFILELNTQSGLCIASKNVLYREIVSGPHNAVNIPIITVIHLRTATHLFAMHLSPRQHPFWPGAIG